MDKIQDMVTRVIKQVFAQMVFMTVESSQTRQVTYPFVRARVGFNGIIEGAILIDLPENIISEITCNMLGEMDENELTEIQKMDAMGELANIICGNLLSEFAGPEPSFDLSAPEVFMIKTPVPMQMMKGKIHQYIFVPLEDAWVGVSLDVNRISTTEPGYYLIEILDNEEFH